MVDAGAYEFTADRQPRLARADNDHLGVAHLGSLVGSPGVLCCSCRAFSKHERQS